MANEIQVKNIESRLPMPAGLTDIDAGKWRVLCESVFPSAKTAEAICMAIDYCRVRKLDPFKRPVNIVPMWNKSLGKEVETVWPGINEVQVTASRTGKYAGMDEPKWGNDITRVFEGTSKWKEGNAWKEEHHKFELTFPEYCAVTVYRIVEGQKCAFTEPVFWLEAYAKRGKTEVPNDMWHKRPKGQLLKVAKAFSLRAAFPEEGEYVAEEMEGKEIEAGGVVIDNIVEEKAAKSHFKNASLRNSFVSTVIRDFEGAADSLELKEWYLSHEAELNAIKATGNEHDLLAVEELRRRYDMAMKRFTAKDDIAASFGEGFSDIRDEPASYAATDMPDTMPSGLSNAEYMESAREAFKESVTKPISNIPFKRVAK